MHPDDKKHVCWLTMLYGMLLLALYLLLTNCGTTRRIAIGEWSQYKESAVVFVLHNRSSLDLASACA